MGVRQVALGLALEVRPLPMAAALLTAVLGLVWARGTLDGAPAALAPLLACVFFALFAAHLADTYVDVVKRDDRTPADFPLIFRDSSGLLAPAVYPPLVGASACASLLFATWPIAARGPLMAAILCGGLALALAYAPLLDRRLLGVSFGYPTGAVAVLAAGYLLGGGALDFKWAWLALAIFLALAGTKIRSDIIDMADDRRVLKCTVAVLWGARRTMAVGYASAFVGLALACAAPLALPVPWPVALPPLAAALGVAATARLPAMASSMAMAGSLFALLALEVAVLAPPAAG